MWRTKYATLLFMKISVDLDGCFWEYPGFFKLVQTYCRELGYEFGILTAHRDIRLYADTILIRLLGIETDFFYSRELNDPRGSKQFKEEIIREHSIDYHFDDCEYGRFSLDNTIVVPPRGEEYEEPADFFYSLSV